MRKTAGRRNSQQTYETRNSFQIKALGSLRDLKFCTIGASASVTALVNVLVFDVVIDLV